MTSLWGVTRGSLGRVNVRGVLFFACGVAALGCSKPEARGVLTPLGFEEVAWTSDESAREIAVRHLRRTESASHHVVRLAGAEEPHVHRLSDLTVTVLSGRVEMHLGDSVSTIGAGQVVDIPRGTPHYAVNLTKGASIAYTVFSPPLDPTDNHPIDR